MSKSCVLAFIEWSEHEGGVSMHEENFVTDTFINYVQANDFEESFILMHNIKFGSNRLWQKVQTIVESLNHLLLLN